MGNIEMTEEDGARYLAQKITDGVDSMPRNVALMGVGCALMTLISHKTNSREDALAIFDALLDGARKQDGSNIFS